MGWGSCPATPEGVGAMIYGRSVKSDPWRVGLELSMAHWRIGNGDRDKARTRSVPVARRDGTRVPPAGAAAREGDATDGSSR